MTSQDSDEELLRLFDKNWQQNGRVQSVLTANDQKKNGTVESVVDEWQKSDSLSSQEAAASSTAPTIGVPDRQTSDGSSVIDLSTNQSPEKTSAESSQMDLFNTNITISDHSLDSSQQSNKNAASVCSSVESTPPRRRVPAAVARLGCLAGELFQEHTDDNETPAPTGARRSPRKRRAVDPGPAVEVTSSPSGSEKSKNSKKKGKVMEPPVVELVSSPSGSEQSKKKLTPKQKKASETTMPNASNSSQSLLDNSIFDAMMDDMSDIDDDEDDVPLAIRKKEHSSVEVEHSSVEVEEDPYDFDTSGHADELKNHKSLVDNDLENLRQATTSSKSPTKSKAKRSKAEAAGPSATTKGKAKRKPKEGASAKGSMEKFVYKKNASGVLERRDRTPPPPKTKSSDIDPELQKLLETDYTDELAQIPTNVSYLQDNSGDDDMPLTSSQEAIRMNKKRSPAKKKPDRYAKINARRAFIGNRDFKKVNPFENEEEAKALKRKIQKITDPKNLTAAQINYLMRSEPLKNHLEAVRSEQIPSFWHQTFNSLRNHTYMVSSQPNVFFTPEQRDLTAELLQHLCNPDQKSDVRDYVLRVQIPEALSFVLQAVKHQTREETQTQILGKDV